MADAKTASKTAETTTTAPAVAATPAKTAPVIGAVTTSVALPEMKSKRGSVSIYPFASLAGPIKNEAGADVYASFHVKGKTKEELSTVVSNANRGNRVEKRDANGAVVYKTKELTAADGTKTSVPTSEAEMIAAKRFVSVEVSETDPEGKGIRIFRTL